MIVWRARTTSVSVFLLKSDLHTARWRFQFGCHFLVGYVISARDTKGFMEAALLQWLYSSFNICCYGPRFTCTQKYGHGQRTPQSDLGADGDVIVVPDNFYFGHWSCGPSHPVEYFGLWSFIQYSSSQIFKIKYGIQFLVVHGNVSADATGVICHQLGLLCTDLHVICCNGPRLLWSTFHMHIEGFQPEWCISTLYHAWDTPFW